MRYQLPTNTQKKTVLYEGSFLSLTVFAEKTRTYGRASLKHPEPEVLILHWTLHIVMRETRY